MTNNNIPYKRTDQTNKTNGVSDKIHKESMKNDIEI